MTDMEVDGCEEITLHDVDIEDELRMEADQNVPISPEEKVNKI